MIRLFVAIKIPGKVKENLLATCKKIAGDTENYRWENPEKIHLTLKFIGEVEENLVSKIGQELTFIENYNSIGFSAVKFGFFFRNGLPTVLWAGLDTAESIYMLVEELNRRLGIFSIPVERRRFKPHLTLLRIKSDLSTEFINKIKDYPITDMKFNSNEVALIKSELFQTGARYTDIKKYKLN
jgi:2'-5' RNA ligase